ncbi:MAG: HEAT repeat domain-containing protein [Terriglobia bacterium]
MEKMEEARRESLPLSAVRRILIPLTVFLLAGSGLVRAKATPPVDKAWNILGSGAAEKGAPKRADAIKALGLLPHDVRARALAEKALADENSDVRAAAAIALGEMHSMESIPGLTKALSDSDPLVVLAAAHSLLTMQDQKAYDVYYAVQYIAAAAVIRLSAASSSHRASSEKSQRHE